MSKIKVEDLPVNEQLAEHDTKAVKGGRGGTATIDVDSTEEPDLTLVSEEDATAQYEKRPPKTLVIWGNKF